jgi:hypothetical protein
MKFSILILLIALNSVAFAQKEKKHLALVRLDSKYGFIDALGHEVVPVIYDDAGYWGNNLVPVNIGKYTRPQAPVEAAIDPGPMSSKDSAKHNEQYKIVDIEVKKETSGKWGYCNASGALVIPVQFTNTTFFKEGRAGVKINNKWGFIDTKGKVIVKPVYDTVGYFSQGLAVVAKDKKYGYINLNGDEVIKLQYVNAAAFGNGYARVSEKFTGKNRKSIGRLINLKGEVLTGTKYDIESFVSGNLASFSLTDAKSEDPFIYGLINTKGQVVAQPIYKEIFDFSDGLAKVMIYKKDKVFNEYNPNYGFIDINGKEIVKVGLAKAESFSYGMAVVARFDDKEDGELDHALINTKGVFILGYNWKQLTLLDRRHLLATPKNKYESIVINVQGKKVSSGESKGIAGLGNGLFAITNSNEEPIGFIGLDKKITINLAQSKNRKFISYQFGLIRFSNLGNNYEEPADVKVGLIDLKGNVIVKPKYNEIADFEVTDSSL